MVVELPLWQDRKVMTAHVGARAGVRRWLPTAVTVITLLGAAVTTLVMNQPEPAARTVASTPLPAGSSVAVPGAAPPAPTAPDLTTVLRLPGDPPVRGEGGFTTAAGTGPILGRSGPLRTFTVAAER